jgi:exosortase A
MQSADTKDLYLDQRSNISWLVASFSLVICATTILALVKDDIAHAISIWIDTPTYSYCFLILPISLWLIHRRRDAWLALEPRPSPWGVAAVAAASIAWLVGDIAGLAELRQFAVVGLIDGMVLAFLGPRVCRALLLPLLYLFLLVPTGTILLAPLQAVTTTLTVHLLRLSGFLLFVEGTTLEAPHGIYIVAPGCAGLNFFLASLALSLLYGDLLYRSTVKKVACVLIALGLSVLANGVRVYGIFAITEVSQRRIDIASDHLLYGWGFFSLVLMAAMAVGHRFADPLHLSRAGALAGIHNDSRAKRAGSPVLEPARTPALLKNSSKTPALPVPRLAATFAAVLGLVIITQGAARSAVPPLAEPLNVSIALPPVVGGWRQEVANTDWLPSGAPAASQQRWAFIKGNHRVDLVLAYVWRQRDGQRLPPLQDWITAKDAWTASEPRALRQGRDAVVQQLSRLGRRRLVYSWYWVAGRIVTDPLTARLWEAWARLRGDGRVALLAISTGADEDSEAEAVLSDFLAGASPIDDVLARAMPGNAG